jgi:peptidyl-dipeptidase Dcp
LSRCAFFPSISTLGDASSPLLISFDDAVTLFHEFGHGCHGMLSHVHYPTLAGTNVVVDYVEFPSQLMEHWLCVDEVCEIGFGFGVWFC